MIFNTGVFLLFFMICFSVYWAVNRYGSVSMRNLILLIASYVFYGYWDWRFLILIIISSVLDFSIGKAIQSSSTLSRRKFLVGISMIVNLGMLGFFKYANFFVEGFTAMLDQIGITVSATTLDIVLPVGISFYTFQTLSYVIDVYRGRVKAEENPITFLTFVAFFPQLVAGPIERAAHMLPQFNRKLKLEEADIQIGATFIFWGLFKKVVLADNLAILSDNFLAVSESYHTVDVFLGIVCFSFQIYCDFSGYSDMALGLARLLGLEITLNFRTPYFSKSFQEFWRRWHITLSEWFRDYVYIPLGGSRVSGNLLIVRNILITFTLSGLWHGAQITFVIWGFVHGMFLIIERLLKSRNLAIPFSALMLLIHLSWLPFRAETSSHLLSLVAGLTHFDSSGRQFLNVVSDFGGLRFGLLWIALVIFMFFEKGIGTGDLHAWLSTRVKRYNWYLYIILGFLFLGVYNAEPTFIYFQF